MMRSIILFLMFLTLLAQKGYSQITFSANDEYGQLYDIVFGISEENVLYARTVGNHIIKSADNGQNWEIIYSDPMDQYCVLTDLRLFNNGNNLSFIVKAEGTAYNKVVIINSSDGTVIKQFDVPNPQQADILIASYDIYEANTDIAVLHTTYTLGFGFTNEVFITINGGATWNSIYFSPEHEDVAINNVAIFPDNPNKIFLMRGVSPGNTIGGLFVSQDSGATWEEKIPGNTYSALAFNPDNANQMLLGTFYGYGTHQENLYRSLDGGETWNVVPIVYTGMSNDNINHIKFNPANTDNIIVLEENEIIISNDNGSTWQNQVYTEIDPEEYYFGLSASFNPFVANDVVISANFYSFRSNDGGITLEKFKNKFVNSTGRIDSHFNGNENHIYYGLRNGFIHKNLPTDTENGYRMRSLNNTFGPTYFPFADKQVQGRIFTSARFGMNSVLEMSLDHGANFTALYSSMEFLNIYTMATAPSNTNLLWFSFGESAYSIDITNPATPVVEQINLPSFELLYGIIIDPITPSRVTITQGTDVYITDNAGLSWTTSSTGLEALVAGQDMILEATINPLDENEYMLATTKGIFISQNKGETWLQLFDEHVDRVHFSDVTPGHIIAINHYSDGYLYPQSTVRIISSTDGGQNWEIVPGAALEYLNASSSTVRFFEDNAEVYFGTFDAGLARFNIDLSTLGTHDYSNGQNISIFPNPASNYFSVHTENYGLTGVTIFSISGQLMLQAKDTLDHIDISNLESGIYLVKIETGSKTYFKRLLKL
ncbi:T9SS type A sorting domain-containing protein [Aequorivita sp. SDUM287046]|uniref:T9SS type A sorting domain-containing protein n=1 Tax=Aequorivita aurantiaca TaxID=3053356 RepID=A0ABT8DJD1_9FLAO|nr:T9SS type A sorting domain-containing protein [Aequorivita aurantiaca]MDN3725491.1 T9SS type A sorting domain-containing protein [Aequorivita aurantiaca]